MAEQRVPKLCEQIRAKLSEMESGELGQLPEEIGAHLRECGSCSSYYSDLLKVVDGLAGLIVPSPSELYPQVMQALPISSPLLNRKMIWLLGILIVALCVLVAEYAYISNTRSHEGATAGASCGTKLSAVVALEVTNTEACSPISLPEQGR